jgi:hypothetical protein
MGKDFMTADIGRDFMTANDMPNDDSIDQVINHGEGEIPVDYIEDDESEFQPTS